MATRFGGARGYLVGLLGLVGALLIARPASGQG